MTTYSPTTWADEVPASTPVKYKITDDIGGVLADSAKIELVTSVTPGTPLNAANLNHIEQGIEDAQDGVNASVPAVYSTKGDLFPGTGSGSGARLPVGSNGQILIADSAQALGMKWATQIVRGEWTNTSWDGDGKTIGSTTITANTFNSNIPANAKAILINASVQWASISPRPKAIIDVVGSISGWSIMVAGWFANEFMYGSGLVILSNGQFRFTVQGVNALSVYLYVIGYIL
jgi:hypothetical protein